MAKKKDITTIDISIKNMLSKCCISVIRNEFGKNNIIVEKIEQGEATVTFDKSVITLQEINKLLEDLGFGIVVSRDLQIIEKIKRTVIDLIHNMNNVDSVVRKSEYLVEMLGLSYQQLSKIFSKYESITLERYIILNKVERIKELILQDEYTLSEIAYMMDYSSVQYLSNQFKKETGYSVTEYKKLGLNLKKPVENLY
jgi:AraC-like DNA-binding protein